MNSWTRQQPFAKLSRSRSGHADVAAVTNKARTLGGSVLMAPNAEVRNGRVAILADPSGAGFVVQELRK